MMTLSHPSSLNGSPAFLFELPFKEEGWLR
jgi:hypothetical protein